VPVSVLPMTGTIKRLVAERGFGFITADDGREFFFHMTMLEGGLRAFHDLTEGGRVTFSEDPNALKGPRAARVMPEKP